MVHLYERFLAIFTYRLNYFNLGVCLILLSSCWNYTHALLLWLLAAGSGYAGYLSCCLRVLLFIVTHFFWLRHEMSVFFLLLLELGPQYLYDCLELGSLLVALLR